MKVKNYSLHIFFFILCSIVLTSVSGQQYPLHIIDSEEGLKKNSVYSITKDHQGYMWLATDAAVVRYDGTDFTYYGYKQGILGNFALDIDFDSSNTMWISTYGGGVAYFNGTKFLRLGTPNGFLSDYVRSLTITKSGEVWFATEDVGVIRKEKNKLPVILKDTSGNNFLNPWQVFEDKDGNMWSAGINGVYFFDKKNNFKPELKYANGFTSTSFVQDKRGDIWSGGAYSLVRFSGDSIINYTSRFPKELIVLKMAYSEKKDEIYLGTVLGLYVIKNDSITTLNQSNGIKNHQFWGIFEDENNDVWLGSGGGGVVKYDTRGISYTSGDDGLKFESMLLDFTELNDGKIIMSTELNGYFLYDNGKFSRLPYEKTKRISSSYATAVDEKSHTIVLTSTQGRIFWLKNEKLVNEYIPKKSTVKIIYDAMLIDSNHLLVATDLGMFTHTCGADTLIPVNGVAEGFYRAVFSDDKNNFWMLGDNGDIYSWNINTNKVSAMHNRINPDKYGMLEGYYDPVNKLYWFCTNQDVLIWNGSRLLKLNSANGLKSEMAVAIAQDKNGIIWLGHDMGLTGVNVKTGKFTYIGHEQGFVGGFCNWRSLLVDRENILWAGSDKNLYRIDLGKINPVNKHTRLRLQEVGYRNTAYFKETYYTDSVNIIELKHDQNNLDFHIKALDFINAKEVQYTWMLKGYDEDFTPYDKNHQAVYTNLPPGDYEFIAKAIDSDGYATNEVHVKIHISKPIWERFWFYALEVALFASIVVMSFIFSSKSSDNRFGQVMTFLTIIILFESIIFYLGNFINPLTNGIPVFQLGMNIVLAAILQPMEQFVKRSMQKLTRRKK